MVTRIAMRIDQSKARVKSRRVSTPAAKTMATIEGMKLRTLMKVAPGSIDQANDATGRATIPRIENDTGSCMSTVLGASIRAPSIGNRASRPTEGGRSNSLNAPKTQSTPSTTAPWEASVPRGPMR